MKTNITEKLNQLNITEETICLVSDLIVSLQLDDDESDKLIAVIEKVTLQHYIRELLKKNMIL